MGLKELFEKILREYEKKYIEVCENKDYTNEFKDVINKELNDKLVEYAKGYSEEINYGTSKGLTIGNGLWSKNPCIPIFDTEITETRRKGVYVAYIIQIFDTEKKKIYLTLEQAVDDKTRDESINKAKEIREKLKLDLNDGILCNDIKFDRIYYKEYSEGEIPDEETLKRDLNTFLEIYKKYKTEIFAKKSEKMIYNEEYSQIVVNSKNVIFHGAPGTGKTYLAKKIAADIVSGGKTNNYEELDEEERERIGFVQFHPSYDYSDFVEGLRPVKSANDSLGFERKDGIFKKFVDNARKNYENFENPEKKLKEDSLEKAIYNLQEKKEELTTSGRKNKFNIVEFDGTNIFIEIPDNKTKDMHLKAEDIYDMLMADKNFEKVKDVNSYFGTENYVQKHSYYLALYKKLKEVQTEYETYMKEEQRKNYVFIIDEINRGEISKIFGELFFTIDPDYRGKKGEVSTQYSNLHDNPNKKFYIPPNVYIIGTMNDIDRSVDTFDFAMRRRFRFIEITAEKSSEMLEDEEAKKRMEALNKVIANEFNKNYQIGAAYFKKIEKEGIDFEELWNNYLQPLLQDYVNGMYNDKDIMKEFEEAYFREVYENI